MDCVVFKIGTGKELKYNQADPMILELIHSKLNEAINEPEIVYRGLYDKETIASKIPSQKEFTTYGLLCSFVFDDEATEEDVLDKLRSFSKLSNLIEIEDKTYSWQLLKLEYIDWDDDLLPTPPELE